MLALIGAALAVAVVQRYRRRAAALAHDVAALVSEKRLLAARAAVRGAFADASRERDLCLADVVDALADVDGVAGIALAAGRFTCARGAAMTVEQLPHVARRLPSPADLDALFPGAHARSVSVDDDGVLLAWIAIAGDAAADRRFCEEVRRGVHAALVAHARGESTGSPAQFRTTRVMTTEALWKHRRAAAGPTAAAS